MEITDSFRVRTPIDETWKVLLDIERIAPCLPGAQLEEIDGDEYRGNVKVKVGPITAQYKGRAVLAEVDEAARRVVIDAAGRDTRGQGNAKATIVVTMSEVDGGTHVDVATDLSITGKVAQFGRGVLADVSSKLMAQFVENLERDVLHGAGNPPDGGSGNGGSGTGGSGTGGSGTGGSGTGGSGNGGSGGGSGNGATAPSAPSARDVSAPAASGPRRVDSPAAAPVDLLEVAGAPVTKRLVPVALGALALFVLWRLLRGAARR